MAICRISPDKKQVEKLAETTFEEQKVEEGKLRDFLPVTITSRPLKRI